MPSCDPALLVDMVADASRGGGRSLRIVAAVSPWKSFAVCGRPAPAGVAEVSKQVKLALFYDAQLDLKAME